ncbi:proline dehydrogenase/delta-1-pyrroline-5-carboxylate dehydrogenase [Klebsiella pneumoniae]|uniref:Proline dehydrogenase/delta-1-pyrroline-5-carboxylate dehydrogenase n=1 Tax=Klebsiella pneumoniae TaxID=573 RepID=A0A377XGV7_KLEPN|nr:proline dehydrogenase/delta-1-pyrroline-5-carboxylate dehydrogenase [Klebsiella pneumoniae]
MSRAAITAAWRRPETDAVPMLLEQARLPQPLGEQAHKLAYQLAEKLRNPETASGRAGMVQSLLQEFSLSSQEGVALMCLAEALLRIPDKATRDALNPRQNQQRQLAVAHRPQPVAVSSTPPPGGCCSPENWCRPITRPASPAP